MKTNITVAIIVVIVLVAGALILRGDSSKQNIVEAPTNKPAETVKLIGEAFEIQGVAHLRAGQKVDNYNSNPPTSGEHAARGLQLGIYPNSVEDEAAVHNLEHGSIWISYKDVDENTIAELEKIAKKYSKGVLLSLREENDSPIAIASWGRLLQLNELDIEQIENFITTNINNSPEKFSSLD